MNSHDSIIAGICGNPGVALEVSDRDGKLVFFNEAYRGLLGLTREELLSRDVFGLCHELDRDMERQRRAAVLADDNLQQSVQQSAMRRMFNRDGRLVWAEVTYVAVDGQQGETLLVATLRDITRERRERLLEQGRNRVLELLYQGVALEKICTEIVASIEGLGEGMLCSILRLDAKQGTLHRLAAPSLPQEYNQAIEGMAIGDGVGSCGTAAFRNERVIVSDLLDHPYWHRARRLAERSGLRACWSEPIVDAEGKVLGTFALYYRQPREPEAADLDLIHAVAALTALVISHCRAAEQLRAADQAKDDFISVAAHELRTPLATILGFSELLLNKNDFGPFSGEERDEFLEEINAKGEMLARLVDELLDVSRLQRNEPLPIKAEPGSLHAAVMSVVEQFHRQYPSCRIEMPAESAFPESISFDRVRIAQVIQNLLSNAVKYSPAEVEVKMDVWLDEQQVVIAVSDRGVGMSREQLAQMFDKYYRADNANTAPSGLGMGLHIARHIVESHGGEISATSAPGQGTRVEFSLPRQQQA